MRMKQFEQNKVKREIKTHGSTYQFYRIIKDEYGESTKEKALVAEIEGLFHTTSGYRTKTVIDGTIAHSKAQPMLLCIYEDSKQLQIDDIVIINEHEYKIVSKTNIFEENILTDISLELILNGKD